MKIMFKNGKVNLVLCGFMGTGKTSVGQVLAKNLGLTFLDLDDLIEKRCGCQIKDIFASEGEGVFRLLEQAAVLEVAARENLVIATGGGVVLNQQNVDDLKINGILVNLTATPETILKRTRHNASRPLLQTADPLQKIKELLAARATAYQACDFMVATDNKNVAAIAREITNLVSEN